MVDEGKLEMRLHKMLLTLECSVAQKDQIDRHGALICIPPRKFTSKEWERDNSLLYQPALIIRSKETTQRLIEIKHMSYLSPLSQASPPLFKTNMFSWYIQNSES